MPAGILELPEVRELENEVISGDATITCERVPALRVCVGELLA
jgi:hypothetical protein